MIKLKDIQLGKVYDNPRLKAFVSVNEVDDVPTKGSDAEKGGVSSAGENSTDMFEIIKNGTGWSTADYILNNPHMNLSENEKILSLLKLASEGMLVDEELMTGKETKLEEFSPESLMTVKRVTEKYSKIKTRYDVHESVDYSSEIGKLTGIRTISVASFIRDNNLDGDALATYIKNGKMKAKMDLITAIVGNPENRYQKKIIKQFKK